MFQLAAGSTRGMHGASSSAAPGLWGCFANAGPVAAESDSASFKDENVRTVWRTHACNLHPPIARCP
eukprot:2736466-Pyramimonas_sp.AAC.1